MGEPCVLSRRSRPRLTPRDGTAAQTMAEFSKDWSAKYGAQVSEVSRLSAALSEARESSASVQAVYQHTIEGLEVKERKLAAQVEWMERSLNGSAAAMDMMAQEQNAEAERTGRELAAAKAAAAAATAAAASARHAADAARREADAVAKTKPGMAAVASLTRELIAARDDVAAARAATARVAVLEAQLSATKDDLETLRDSSSFKDAECAAASAAAAKASAAEDAERSARAAAELALSGAVDAAAAARAGAEAANTRASSLEGQVAELAGRLAAAAVGQAVQQQQHMTPPQSPVSVGETTDGAPAGRSVRASASQLACFVDLLRVHCAMRAGRGCDTVRGCSRQQHCGRRRVAVSVS